MVSPVSYTHLDVYKRQLEVSHTLQAETYYNHFNMQKLYCGGGYGGTEKGNRAQDIYDLYSGYIPGLQGAYVYDYNEDTSWGLSLIHIS